MAVVYASSYSADLTPSLGISVGLWCSHKKKSGGKKKRKKTGKKTFTIMWVIFSMVVGIEFISVLPTLPTINMIYLYKGKRNINGIKVKATKCQWDDTDVEILVALEE